jgi:outer membrane protein OmpA-like peptidoglycan-associated protein
MSFRTPNEVEVLTYQMPRNLMLNKLLMERGKRVEIFYDLNKWDIREDAKPILDSLVRFMEINPIQAELSSHTDSRATAEYNLNLSQKRAEAAVQYIVEKGISSSRITAKGYGESQLVNRCADGVSCSEAEHQENRRTEFKIIGIDPLMFKENKLDLDVFRERDIISPSLLDVNFFGDCNNKAGLNE